MPIPVKYPAAAAMLMCLAYHTKSTFSRPIKATPAALPMTNMDPPVPAQNAMSCHSSASIGTVSVEYLGKGKCEW